VKKGRASRHQPQPAPPSFRQVGAVFRRPARSAQAWHWRERFFDALIHSLDHMRQRMAEAERRGADVAALTQLADEIEADLHKLHKEARRRGLKVVDGDG
jgi:hypothetical protein